jgi:iron-sulfur cluster repair protein YtfE (RIC family)
MKRHPSLQPLSREHHEVLIVAQLLRKDAPPYKGLPRDAGGRARYALDFYASHMVAHIYSEEKMLFPAISGFSTEIDRLITELQTEHSQIVSLFEQLRLGISPLETMDFLGKLLVMHVRKEERELFELIQRQVPGEVLEKLTIPAG